MLNIEEIKREKPYVESALTLYSKLRDFRSACLAEKGRFRARKEAFEFVLQAFSSTFHVPFEALSFLATEMLEEGIDPTQDPKSVWTLSFYHDEIGEEEKKRMLFILSRPFFLWLERRQDSFWEGGRCPVCKAEASLGRITGDNRKRLICTVCEFEGPFYRIGCPHCLNRDSRQIEILLDEEEVRLELCSSCKTYLKVFTEEHSARYEDPFLIDIITLPLDMVGQGRGFVRRSPNALGLGRLL